MAGLLQTLDCFTKCSIDKNSNMYYYQNMNSANKTLSMTVPLQLSKIYIIIQLLKKMLQYIRQHFWNKR